MLLHSKERSRREQGQNRRLKDLWWIFCCCCSLFCFRIGAHVFICALTFCVNLFAVKIMRDFLNCFSRVIYISSTLLWLKTCFSTSDIVNSRCMYKVLDTKSSYLESLILFFLCNSLILAFQIMKMTSFPFFNVPDYSLFKFQNIRSLRYYIITFSKLWRSTHWWRNQEQCHSSHNLNLLIFLLFLTLALHGLHMHFFSVFDTLTFFVFWVFRS